MAIRPATDARVEAAMSPAAAAMNRGRRREGAIAPNPLPSLRRPGGNRDNGGNHGHCSQGQRRHGSAPGPRDAGQQRPRNEHGDRTKHSRLQACRPSTATLACQEPLRGEMHTEHRGRRGAYHRDRRNSRQYRVRRDANEGEQGHRVRHRTGVHGCVSKEGSTGLQARASVIGQRLQGTRSRDSPRLRGGRSRQAPQCRVQCTATGHPGSR